MIPPRPNATFPEPLPVRERPVARKWTLIAVALGTAYWALVTWMAIAEYETFNTTARDLAVYLQVVWNTAHGQPFATTLLENNRLHVAEHLAGLLALLAPLYRALPDPRWLLGLQQAAVALSGAPVFLWARHALGARWAALVLACYYAMPTLAEAALDAFYPIVFAAVPLGFSAYFALRSRPGAAVLLGVLALPIEEESGLVALGIGIFLLSARQSRRWGALLASVAMAWLVVGATVVMPGFHERSTIASDGNRTVGHFDELRANPGGMAAAFVQRRLPLAAEWLLLPTGGVALLGPRVLAITAPELGALLLADREGRYRRHWVAPALPIIWLATVSGIARLRHTPARSLAGGLMVAGSITAFAIDSSLPGGGDYEPYDTVWSPRAEQLQRALAEVPADVSVAASRRILAYLAHRHELYVYPPSYAGALWPVEPAPRHWVFDLSNDQTREHLAGRSSPLRAQAGSVIWTLGPDAAVLTPAAPSLATASDLALDWVRLRAWETRVVTGGEELLLLWESARRPARPQMRAIKVTDASGAELHRVDSNPLDQMYPPTEWPRGQQWVDRVLLPPLPRDARLHVAWSERSRQPAQWHEVGRLP